MTRRIRSVQISDVIRAAIKLPSGLDVTDQANTARNQANTAFDHANTAYSHAGNAFNHANNAHNQANSAYAQANAAYSAANTKLNSSGGTISGNLIVTGNLFVEGDSTSFNVASLLIEDSEIYLNSNQTTPSLNASIFAERGSSTDTFIRWNESLDGWGWSDNGTTTYYFDHLRAGLATTNTTFGTINTSLGTINTNIGTAYAQANAAYGQANTARSDANTTFATINTTFGTLNTSAETQNTTFGTINTNIGTAYSQANAAYGQANSAFAAANNRVLKSGDTMTGALVVNAGTAEIYARSTSGANGQILADGSNLYIGPVGAHGLRLQTNGSTRVLVNSDGNVGIGNTNPQRTLVVAGTIESTSGGIRFPDGTTQNTAAASAAGGTPTLNVVSGTTVTAVKDNHYVLVSASATTVTLPASPSAADVIWVTIANGRVDNIIARNGRNINSLAEDMTVDVGYVGIQLRYADATRGWVFSS